MFSRLGKVTSASTKSTESSDHPVGEQRKGYQVQRDYNDVLIYQLG